MGWIIIFMLCILAIGFAPVISLGFTLLVGFIRVTSSISVRRMNRRKSKGKYVSQSEYDNILNIRNDALKLELMWFGMTVVITILWLLIFKNDTMMKYL